MALWWRGAIRKHDVGLDQRLLQHLDRQSRSMPSAASTSAAPDLEVKARLPCLATGHAGAGDDEGRAGRDVVGAVVVAAGADDIDRALGRPHAQDLGAQRQAPPANLARPSRRAPCRPIRKAPICAGVASPLVMMSKARSASPMVSVWPLPTLAKRPRKSSMSPLTGPPCCFAPCPAGRHGA